ISDGGDNVSKHKYADVSRDVLDSLVTIYTVGIFDQDDPERNPRVLEQLAHVSGGAVYFPKELSEVVPVCRSIAKDIRSRYTIGYVPRTEGKPMRHIKVTAASPDHPKLVVRTRTSYHFGDAEEAKR